MDINQLRYIVFLIDSKYKEHDGKIFSSHKDALEFTNNIITEKYADKAIIGMFTIDLNCEELLISMIQTIGFVGDKKDVYQLDLFKQIK